MSNEVELGEGLVLDKSVRVNFEDGTIFLKGELENTEEIRFTDEVGETFTVALNMVEEFINSVKAIKSALEEEE